MKKIIIKIIIIAALSCLIIKLMNLKIIKNENFEYIVGTGWIVNVNQETINIHSIDNEQDIYFTYSGSIKYETSDKVKITAQYTKKYKVLEKIVTKLQNIEYTQQQTQINETLTNVVIYIPK